MRVFAQNRNLLHFINRLLVPYLFSYTYYHEHGRLPHGELSHGMLGLLEYYKDFFAVDVTTVLKLLKVLADSLAPPLMQCPRGSGKALQSCHGPKLDALRPHYPPAAFEAELCEMIRAAQAANISLPERAVMPRRMWKRREKRREKETRRR